MNSKVAVIIPCFNAERFLGLTLDSVLAQDYYDFRVIAVDDGSTDNTVAILNSYSDRITVLTHEDNGNHGQAAALNLGLSHADSEYIAFMDADDIWHSDKLRKQAEILDQYKDVGLVYTNGYVIDSDGKVLYSLLSSEHCETNEAGSVLLNCYIRTPSMVMVRKSELDKVGTFTVGLNANDHEMWIRLQESTKFYYLNEKLTSYRQHPGQISTTGSRKMWENGFRILGEAFIRYPYPASIRRKRRAVIHYRLGGYAMATGEYIPTMYHFLMAFLNDPFRALKNIKRVLQ